MGKKKQANTIQELFDTLDAGLYEKAYTELNRTAPNIAATITRLVEAGVEPDQILQHILSNHHHRWIEGQMIRAAARHVKGEIEG